MQLNPETDVVVCPSNLYYTMLIFYSKCSNRIQLNFETVLLKWWLFTVFCPERKKERIFSGWQIKNPLDGPAARLFFRWINDDDICIRLLMSDNEIIICQLISRCAVHACNVSFHWFLRLNRKWLSRRRKKRTTFYFYQCSAPKKCLRLKQKINNG